MLYRRITVIIRLARARKVVIRENPRHVGRHGTGKGESPAELHESEGQLFHRVRESDDNVGRRKSSTAATGTNYIGLHSGASLTSLKEFYLTRIARLEKESRGREILYPLGAIMW